MKKSLKAAAALIAVATLAVPITACSPTTEPHNKNDNIPQSVSTDSTRSNGLQAKTLMEADSVAGESAVDPTSSYIDVPEGYNTEEYSAVDEKGFISTKANPLSTVSSDVDTASYCNLRRMLRDGYKIDDVPEGAVRVEEMLNYFDYDYPDPSGADKFSITPKLAPCPWNADTELLTIGFNAADEVPVTAGSNLVFLIDTSGSMDSPDKIDLLKQAFGTLVEQLSANDRISIVTYSGEEKVLLEGAAGNDKAHIMEAVNALECEGYTNGGAGMQKAYDIAEKNKIDGGVNRIIMASDGDLNVGMTSESSLEEFVSKKRDTGIYLSVLGFGAGNYKDTKMETIADKGNGNYSYIDCVEEAERVFKEKLTANLVPFANDVKIQVEFNPAEIKAYRLIGYENREMADEDFKNDAKDAGDVGPGSQFVVAYELVKAESPFQVAEPELKYGGGSQGEVNGEWMTVSMRYKPIIDGKAQDAVDQTRVIREEEETPQGDGTWTFQAGVIETAMLLRKSDYKGTTDLRSAKDIVNQAETGNSQRDEFKQLVNKLE